MKAIRKLYYKKKLFDFQTEKDKIKNKEEKLNLCYQKSPKNKEYYDILNVDEESSISDIRKSYYKKSQKYHPDKNIELKEFEKKEMEEKFKEINKAYSVLSDPEKRNLYNMYGNQEIIKTETLDENYLSISFFGNTDICFFIGKLKIFSKIGDKKDKNKEMLKLCQQKRELEIFENLSKLLDYPDSNKDEFITSKINSIMENKIGEFVMNFISFLYIKFSECYLNNKIIKSLLFNKKNKFIASLRMVKSFTNYFLEKNDSYHKGKFIWLLVSFDIINTVENYCDKLFYDITVSKEIKKRRAENLLKIGKQIYNPNLNQEKYYFVIGEKVNELVIFT